MSARCDVKLGQTTCGFLLVVGTDGRGGVVTRCPACERQKHGLCVGCPNPIRGRARWCTACKRRARTDAVRRWRTECRDHYNAVQRKRYARLTAEQRAERKHYNRLWKLAHPEHAQPRRRETPRVCCAPGCDRVVTSRKKKCSRCKEAQRQAAVVALRSRAA